MSALLVAVLLTQAPVTLVSTSPHCYVADDRTAGWKEAAIPNGAPALAAPDGVEQFRSGEDAWVVRGPTVSGYSTDRRGWGTVALHFPVPKHTTKLDVRFAQRLDGMRVEVVGSGGWVANVPLQAERRYTGTALSLEWTAKGVEQVTIVLHHHMRAAPVVAEWSSARREPMRTWEPKKLSWLQPAGAAVELCDAPGRPLRVNLENLP